MPVIVLLVTFEPNEAFLTKLRMHHHFFKGDVRKWICNGVYKQSAK
jgi:hypothetical protein